MKWLFLVHQIQTTNSRERVKIWRLTKKLGAILYRNSVYVLPYDKERLEDFQWLCREINDSKGEASVFITETNNSSEEMEIKRLFIQKRAEEFQTIYKNADNILLQIRSLGSLFGTDTLSVKKISKETKLLNEEFAELKKIDFFKSANAKLTERRIGEINFMLNSSTSVKQVASIFQSHFIKDFQNKIWSTRKNIHIDRISSAWLIKTFIDKKAKFIFTDENKLPANSIKFDSVNGVFTHQGDNCTFETIIKSFGIKDPILMQIAEIVHDIDLKDQKFGKIEASGVDLLIRSISSSSKNDNDTLKLGCEIFNSLYKYLSSKKN